MNQRQRINTMRYRRQNRVRARIYGTASRPRLSIFRSNHFTYAQLIDDATGKTLVSASTRGIKEKGKTAKSNVAKSLGNLIAEKAKKEKIIKAIVDRGKYKYHGRVRALVEGAREGGLQI